MWEKFFERLATIITKHYIIIIALTIITVICLSLFISKLYIENDIQKWISKDSPEGSLNYYVSQKFGNTTPILIVLEFKDLFTKKNLMFFKQVTETLENLPEVDFVQSIMNTYDIKSTEEGIVVENLIKEIPQSDEEAKRLRDYILSKDVYTGRLISKDANSVLVILKVKREYRSDVVAKKIRTLVGKMIKDNGIEVKAVFGGVPSLMNSISELVVKDLMLLVPIVTLVVVGTLFVSFRTVRGVILPLSAVGFATLITMGLMGLLGRPLSVIGAAIPVILVAVGNAYGIHILNKYYEDVEKFNSDKSKIIISVLKEVGLPVLMAGLTTFFGFISLAISDLIIVRDFGIFISLGVLLAVTIALIFIPSLLMLLKLQKTHYIPPESHPLSTTFAKNILKYRIPIFAFFIISSLVFIYFIPKIKPKMDYISYFRPNTEPRIVSSEINKKFGGYNPYILYVKSDLYDPDILKILLMAEVEMDLYKENPSPLGIASTICELNYAVVNIKTIPETKEEVQNLWFLIEGKREVESIVSKDKREAIISILLPYVESDYLSGFVKKMNKFIEDYKNFVVIPSSPTNTYLQELVAKMLYVQLNGKIPLPELLTTVKSLSEKLMKYTPKIDTQKIYDYLLSDESEIPLKPYMAKRIVEEIKATQKLDLENLKEIIRKFIPNSYLESKGYTEEDVESLARSIYSIVKEQKERNAIGMLIREFREMYKVDISDKKLNFALSPFLWERIPVPGTSHIEGERKQIERIEQTGFAFISEIIRKKIWLNQLSTLAMALLAVFILNSLTFESILEGLFSLIAIIYTLLVNFGLMGLLKIPLDNITMAIASIAIGVGIDYTIHFINRYNLELRRRGDREEAIKLTLSTTGKAIIINALSVGLGFSVLLLSQIAPLQTLGGLLALTMLVSSVSALTLLPLTLTYLNVLKANIGR